MKSLQAQKGHIDIPHQIAEQLAKLSLNGTQWRLLWVIWRKTWGWHKKDDFIPLSQFEKATALDRRLISRELKRLEKRKIIFIIGRTGKMKKYTFNKDYNHWAFKRLSTKKTIVQKVRNFLLNSRGVSTKPTPSKETISKENNSKTTTWKKQKELIEELSKWLSLFKGIRNPKAMAKCALNQYGYKAVLKAFKQMNREYLPNPSLFWQRLKENEARRNTKT